MPPPTALPASLRLIKVIIYDINLFVQARERQTPPTARSAAGSSSRCTRGRGQEDESSDTAAVVGTSTDVDVWQPQHVRANKHVKPPQLAAVSDKRGHQRAACAVSISFTTSSFVEL